MPGTDSIPGIAAVLAFTTSAAGASDHFTAHQGVRTMPQALRAAANHSRFCSRNVQAACPSREAAWRYA